MDIRELELAQAGSFTPEHSIIGEWMLCPELSNISAELGYLLYTGTGGLRCFNVQRHLSGMQG